MNRFLLAALAVLFLTGSAVLGQIAMPPDLTKARQAFLMATQKADKGTSQPILTEDFTWVDRGGRLRDKKTVIDELRQPDDRSVGSEQARMYPGGAVIVSERKLPDGPVTTRVLQVWVQQNGQWRLAAHHGIPAATEKVQATMAASSPLPPNVGAPADLGAIDEAIAALNAGNRRNDVKNFAALVTDDFAVVTRTGVLFKQDRMTELSSGKPPQSELRTERSSTRIYGDMAVVNRFASGTTGRVYQTFAYVKQNGKWLRAAVITTPVAAS